MTSSRKWLALFVSALVASPIFVFLHELGHYAAGAFLGFSVKLHYGQVTGTMPKEAIVWRGDAVQASAGPLVQAVLALTGFVWLRRLRQHRREATATTRDWLATITIVLNAGPWFRGIAEPLGSSQLVDEALVSEASGPPAWLLPCLLGFLAVIAIFATIQLHPPGNRLLPFVCVGLGGAIGFFAWIRIVGPFLLP